MGQSVRYVTAWVLCTAAAVGVSWLGVRSVLDAGAPTRPELVVGMSEQASAAPPPTTPPPPPTTDAGTTSPTSSAPPTTSETTDGTTTTPPPVTTTTTTPPAPAGTATATDGGTWVQEGGRPVYIRSFALRGGDVAVRFTPETTEAISATPRSGFSVAVEQPGGPLVVNFRSPERLSRLEAFWADGPRWKLIEEP